MSSALFFLCVVVCIEMLLRRITIQDFFKWGVIQARIKGHLKEPTIKIEYMK
jgi:hypothetical protein